MEILLSNPLLLIIVTVVCILVGKYVWMSKDDEKNISKDMNAISQKLDITVSKTKEDFLKEIHDMELAFAEKQGNQAEKLRIVQKEIMDEADRKYFTKEMAERHDERISKMEEIINAILPRMEKIDVMFDMIKDKK